MFEKPEHSMVLTKSGHHAQRADAARNVERILDAAVICLSRRRNTTMAEIAGKAGLGRVTLYGHFATRAALVDAVVARVLERGEQTLGSVDLEGDPRDALVRLVSSSWQLVDQSRSIITAAEDELPPERIWQLHDKSAARIEALIARGRRSGLFRTDMPTSWQVAVVHQVLHGAGAEVASGRLQPADAPQIISITISALLTTAADTRTLPLGAS